jgi:arginine/ornithine transport system substrate-binding protein
MKKLGTVVLIMAALATLLLTVPAMAKTVKVGTEGAYPPFNLVDDKGELQGFDVDIAKALCKQAGYDCEFSVVDWDGLIPALLAKKIDCIIASMSITEERKEKVDFTDKYYVSPGSFVAKKDAGIDVTDKGALKGKIIGVQRATIHENFIRDNYADVLEIKSYATQEEANMDMVSGRVDLLFADKLVLLGGFIQTEEGKDYEFVGPDHSEQKWFGDGIGIAVRKGDTELLEGFNAAIKAIRDNGEYAKINKEYFDFDLYGE